MAQKQDETLQDQTLKDEKPIRESESGVRNAAGGEEDSSAASGTDRAATLTPEEELEQYKAKAEECFNQLQRLQADFDNYKKRTQKEKTEIIKYASERLIKDLLPVLDNFERAVEAAKVNPDFASFSQGVSMILRQLQDVLGKEGLRPMEAIGQPFDPNLHEAVHRVDSEEHSENIIVEELQKGYFLKEKVLRPGMVTVSN